MAYAILLLQGHTVQPLPRPETEIIDSRRLVRILPISGMLHSKLPDERHFTFRARCHWTATPISDLRYNLSTMHLCNNKSDGEERGSSQ